MEAVKPQIVDGTVLTNRQNRQKRPNRRYLRAKCGQEFNQVATGLVVWNQPSNPRLNRSLDLQRPRNGACQCSGALHAAMRMMSQEAARMRPSIAEHRTHLE